MLSVVTQLFVTRHLQQTGFISRCPVLVLVVFRFLWWTELMEWKHLTCAVFTCLDFSRISLRCKPDASGLSSLEWNLLILLNSDSLSLKYGTVFKLMFFKKNQISILLICYTLTTVIVSLFISCFFFRYKWYHWIFCNVQNKIHS